MAAEKHESEKKQQEEDNRRVAADEHENEKNKRKSRQKAKQKAQRTEILVAIQRRQEQKDFVACISDAENRRAAEKERDMATAVETERDMATAIAELQGTMNMRCREVATVMGEMSTDMAELLERVNRNEAAIKREMAALRTMSLQSQENHVTVKDPGVVPA